MRIKVNASSINFVLKSHLCTRAGHVIRSRLADKLMRAWSNVHVCGESSLHCTCVETAVNGQAQLQRASVVPYNPDQSRFQALLTPHILNFLIR
jgi:hypothetical protein